MCVGMTDHTWYIYIRVSNRRRLCFVRRGFFTALRTDDLVKENAFRSRIVFP
jgi:hypothetical protein